MKHTKRVPLRLHTEEKLAINTLRNSLEKKVTHSQIFSAAIKLQRQIIKASKGLLIFRITEKYLTTAQQISHTLSLHDDETHEGERKLQIEFRLSYGIYQGLEENSKDLKHSNLSTTLRSALRIFILVSKKQNSGSTLYIGNERVLQSISLLRKDESETKIITIYEKFIHASEEVERLVKLRKNTAIVQYVLDQYALFSPKIEFAGLTLEELDRPRLRLKKDLRILPLFSLTCLLNRQLVTEDPESDDLFINMVEFHLHYSTIGQVISPLQASKANEYDLLLSKDLAST